MAHLNYKACLRADMWVILATLGTGSQTYVLMPTHAFNYIVWHES